MKIPMALWARLMPLLDQALDLPRAEREAWLGRQDLDADTAAALRQLLADREQLDSGDFMAELPRLDASAGSASSASDEGQARAGQHSQSGLFAGDMLGPYRLIRQLGQGGMSVVWLAERDDGQMRRHVALKMPHAGPGQALLAERLRRERDILASLEHRNIARLYDVGVTAMGLPFLVLEYIEGQPLPAYCDELKLGLYARLRLFLQVLGAVQYAHTKLVLHRDLKPSNILVSKQGEVKLLDFGIAKLIRDSETGAAPSTELTQHNGHVLTPDYAAPEQIAGSPLTTASDVYALGVILFELLTGQRPYRLPRGTRGALEEAILATDPRRPSQVWQDADVQTHHLSAVTLTDLAEHYQSNPRRLSQQLRGDLDVIVAKALQKQTARRYPTAEAFAQDIAHHLAKEPIAAQPDSRWYRTRKYVQRHAWALTAVGAVVLALSVGLGLALWQAREARQEAAKANAIKDFLVGLFENGDVEQADALRKRQQTVEQLLVNSANALGTQLKDQPQVRVELQGVVGGLLHNLAITDAAIKLRQQRVDQLEAMGADVAARARALRELANSQDARGDAVGARASLDKGLALCRTVSMTPVDVCYGLQVARGQIDVVARNMNAAEERIIPALKILQSAAPNSDEYAEALIGLGDILSLQNKAEDSFELYEKAMILRGKRWGATSVRLAQERYQLAMSLAAVGRLSQADKELEAGWALMKASLGPDHLNSCIFELQLGRLRAMLAMGQNGAQLVRHASGVILKEQSRVDQRRIVEAYWARGEVELGDGDMTQAGKDLLAAFELHRRLPQDVMRDGLLDITVAWYLVDVGRYEQGRAILLEARQTLLKTFGDTHANLHVLDDAIASSFLAQERYEDVWQWLRKSWPTLASSVTPDNAPEAFSSATWGAMLMAQGRWQEAAPFVRGYYHRVMGRPKSDAFRLEVFSANDLMARLHVGLGRYAEAKAYFEASLAVMKAMGPMNPYVAAARSRYVVCLIELGDVDAARQQFRAAAKAIEGHAELGAHFLRPYHVAKQRIAQLSNLPRL